ncbi:hypothetical protein R3P38DRAFT_2775761 [Favolaschia claudopus]|uniref:Uncharacterized protein n=1 Tax=Favolaschia claudopus TaxID=2862362 RepID=A0AAW0BSN3_9AGAR
MYSPIAYKQIPKSPEVQIEKGEEENRKSRPILPPKKYIEQLNKEARQAILDGKLSVQDSRYPNIRFSLWIIAASRWLVEMTEAQDHWKAAEEWVNKKRPALPAADAAAGYLSAASNIPTQVYEHMSGGRQFRAVPQALRELHVPQFALVSSSSFLRLLSRSPELINEGVMIKLSAADSELYTRVNGNLQNIVAAVKALGAGKKGGRGKEKQTAEGEKEDTDGQESTVSQSTLQRGSENTIFGGFSLFFDDLLVGLVKSSD